MGDSRRAGPSRGCTVASNGRYLDFEDWFGSLFVAYGFWCFAFILTMFLRVKLCILFFLRSFISRREKGDKENHKPVSIVVKSSDVRSARTPFKAEVRKLNSRSPIWRQFNGFTSDALDGKYKIAG
jgi:hypothetical protein